MFISAEIFAVENEEGHFPGIFVVDAVCEIDSSHGREGLIEFECRVRNLVFVKNVKHVRSELAVKPGYNEGFVVSHDFFQFCRSFGLADLWVVEVAHEFA